MVPMRSVPHRVVCLLGLDDGVFPALGAVDGDDVLARTPLTGERDVRSEDRQLLLDAIGAATETLVVTYTGADEHTGQPRPPAVPLGELLDALDRTTAAPVRDQARRPALRCSPSTSRNVEPGRLGVPDARSPSTRPCSTAAHAAAGDRGPRCRRSSPAPLAAAAARARTSSLADLLAFFRDPVKGFFRALDLTLPWDVDGVADAMPVEIDALETWGVGDRMLDDMLRGVHPDQALAGRVAARHAAAGTAGLAQGRRGPRPGHGPGAGGADPPAGRAARRRRRRRPAGRPPAHRHRRTRSTPTGWSRSGYSRLGGKHLLDVVDPAAGPGRRTTPTTTGPP